MNEDNKKNYSDMILSFAKKVPIIGTMVSAGKSSVNILKKIKSMQDKNKTKRSIGPAGASTVSDDGKRMINRAKGGMVKKYMGGGSVHKNKKNMITTRGWGASRKT